jgi:phosphoglycerol transferase MdoB-like AlkP superfamily enzyme
VEVARKIADLVKTHGPKVFVFAITMENHGPWLGAGELPTTNLLPEIGLPSGAQLALERYVQSLRNADEMLGILTATLSNEGTEGLLAFYGDHLPAFRQTFDTLGFSDLRSDYFIWSPASASAARRDIAARELQAALLQSRFGDERSQRRCANG